MNGSIETPSPVDTRVAFNKRRVALLATAFGSAIFLAVTLVLAVLGAGRFAPLLGLVLAVVWLTGAWLYGDRVVLHLTGVDPANRADHARLYNVVEGLCVATGVAVPTLYVVDDPALNAMTAGRYRRRGSLVFTQGLLDESSLVELEAVVSLLLHKLKSHDAIPETFVVPTVGSSGVLSELSDSVDWLSRALSLPTPAIEKVIAWLHPSRGELDTDLAAVGTTRYPPALASALEKMNGRSAIAAASPVTDHLWIAPPLAMSSRRNVARIHAQLSERIAVLQEL